MKRPLFLLAFLLCLPLLKAHAAKAPHIVFMIGENEYKTWETLPAFAEKDLKPAGYRVTIIHADTQDTNNFPGLTAVLKDADLLFLSARRRTPHKDQLDAVRAHLAAGKPLVGIRTASHAFALRPKDKLEDPKLDLWQRFDPEVLGGNYSNHHGNGPKTVVTVAPGAEAHPILKGVAATKIVSAGSLYKASPLEKDTTSLLLGTIPDKPSEPIAWTNIYGPKKGRIFYTSLGHVGDFENPEFRRLLVNAVEWAVAK
jgi:type 1 glutamine amidotransferase